MQATPHILAGLTVIDITRVLAGPWCTQLLADFGATVIKIENPEGGDDTRKLPPHLPGPDGQREAEMSGFFLSCNRGKKSVVVDLKSLEDRAALLELIRTADVLVENFKVGDLVRYGLDQATLRALNPRLIYCSITGYGQTGPMAGHPGYDILFQGMSGAMSTCGLPDSEPGGGPVRTLVANTDLMTGLYACTGILAALQHRNVTGEGQYIDIALLDVAIAANAHIASNYLISGKSQERIGNSGISAAPSGVYACRDGHIIIQSSQRQWARLCDALGKPEWRQDTRFIQLSDRLANAAALDLMLDEVTRQFDKQELVARVSGAGVPCAPVNTIGESFDEPQVRHRGVVATVTLDDGREVPVVTNPLRMSAAPLAVLPPPRFGQHTREVLDPLRAAA